MTTKPKMTPFAKASLVSQFNILFILISIIPLGIIYYLYVQLKSGGELELTADNLSMTLMFVVLGIGVGYFVMSLILRKIMNVTKASKTALENIFGQEKLKKMQEGDNEVAVLTRTFNEVTTKLEENVQKLELAKETLQTVLTRVGEGISSIQNIDTFLELIVETIAQAIGGKSGILFLTDEERTELYVNTIYGDNKKVTRKTKFSIDNSIFSSVILSKQNLVVPKMDEVALKAVAKQDLFEFPMVAAPLLIHDKVLGVIAICGRTVDINFGDEEISLVSSVALQTAVAVENDKLNVDAEKTYFDIISALAFAVEAKDPYSRGHLDRVSDYSVKIAEKMNLNEEDKRILRDAARLHDLGKIGVTDDILCKPGPLNDQEWVVMKNHPAIGEGIVKPVTSLSNLCDIIRHHHEKLDGSGYPDGLKGEEIHPLVRILAVADIVDAIMTDRPYRKALTEDQAKKALRDMGDTIDQSIVDVLISIL
ncbi:MAG: HD domain-containing protein [Candidatus Aceula meridiana]|nr:HD domain-containing protein [Candidatus Aceula meridiana]